MDAIRKIALWTTGLIVLFILVSCLILSVELSFMKLPRAPALSTATTTAEQEVNTKMIANYKDLVSAMQGQKTAIFDIIVIKALLPLFSYVIASVLTYIFAKTALDAYSAYLTHKFR